MIVGGMISRRYKSDMLLGNAPIIVVCKAGNLGANVLR